MNRFHVHLRVADLDQSIGFYSRLFGAAPSRQEADYAKWMLDDPRINFAISTRGGTPGLDHFGLQADNAEALQALRERAESADLTLADTGETTCCYARSDKHWITDPQGLAWEHFHTLADVPTFGATATASPAPAKAAAACCPPAASSVKSSCC